MTDPYTPEQKRVIDALMTITCLETPCFAHLGEGKRVTITHNECIYVLEEDGSISDGQTLLAWESRETLARNTPKEKTLHDAIELDDRLNREARCPTGEDYNTVMALVRSALRHGPLLTFDAGNQDTALRLLRSIEGHSVTLNGTNVELEGTTQISLVVRDCTPRRGVRGASRIVAWADVKTIHVQ